MPLACISHPEFRATAGCSLLGAPRTLTTARHLTIGGHPPGTLFPPKQRRDASLANRLNKRRSWCDSCSEKRVAQSPRGVTVSIEEVNNANDSGGYSGDCAPAGQRQWIHKAAGGSRRSTQRGYGDAG